ncbi:hypothetical protein [Enterococcus sp. AZ109]|uniref:hypothetical protein n=1 Tax=Enterococcus sp. AZ109 TaxID=2774634 RepID=UPI003F26B2C2
MLNAEANHYQQIADIGDIIKRGSASESEIACLYKIAEDHTLFWGRKMSAFAIAALDRIGVEKYEGHNETILEIINDWEPKETQNRNY